MVKWIVVALAGSIIVWGTVDVERGVKWTWRNKGCIIHHGVKACRAKTAAIQVSKP